MLQLLKPNVIDNAKLKNSNTQLEQCVPATHTIKLIRATNLYHLTSIIISSLRSTNHHSY